MTSNSLIYKDADVKSRVAPQIFLIFLAVLIFYQSYYIHTGFLTAAHMRFFDEALTFFVSTLSYVLMIVPAGILATNWNAKKLLCLSIAGIGLLHYIRAIFKFDIDTDSESWLSIVGFNLLFGVIEAPVLPCVYVLLSRMISPRHRTTAASLVLSAKQFIVLFTLGIALLSSINSFGSVEARTQLIFGISAVIWSIEYDSVGSNYDLEFVNEAPTFKPEIPWRSMLSSFPVWTLIMSHTTSFALHEMIFSDEYGYPFELPDVLRFVKSTSARFSLLILGGIGSGYLSDALVAQKYLTRLTARKMFNFLAICVPMIACALISIKYELLDRIGWTFIRLILTGLISFQSSGFMFNHMDLSPYYAGILIAITEAANQLFKSLVLLIFIYYKFERISTTFITFIFFIHPVFTGIFFTICGKASIQDKWSPVPLSYQNQNKLNMNL